MSIENITEEDVDFFRDMVNLSRTIKPKFYRHKPYYKILDDPQSEEFQRFIKIYNKTKYILNEREQEILDALYGIHKPRVTLKEASKPHNITPERVRQIVSRAERKIIRKLHRQLP